MKEKFHIMFWLVGLIIVMNIFSACKNSNLPVYKDATATVENRVNDLLKRMTLEEKVAQTHCVAAELFVKNNEVDTIKLDSIIEHGIGEIRDYFVTDERNSVRINNFIQKRLSQKTRLGIPAIVHGEGLHGYVNDNATSFPQAIALASTWNPNLIKQVCRITANEARSRGVQQLLSPVLDIARDPRWGRFSETFGEDPYLTGEIAVQIIKGFQGETASIGDSNHLIATIKHFPGSGTTTGGLNVAPMVTTEREFREIFLYPFKQAVTRGGALGVMPFYGEYDGIPTHTNTWLLRNILRKEWGFKGIVVSDYFALELLTKGWIWEFNKHQMANDSVEAAQMALMAGVNVEAINTKYYSALAGLVKSGKIPESVLDEIVKEILTLKFKLGLFDKPYTDAEKAVEISNDAASKKVALEAARQAVIMLKNNDQLLPINPVKIKTIAVIGPNAKDTILGDYSTKKPKYFVSVYDGIKQRAGSNYTVLYSEGCKITPPLPEYADQLKKDRQHIDEAVKIAEKSDIVILAMGGNIETDREGRDRSDLQMLGLQNELIMEICKTGKPVVLCLFGGKLYAIPEIYKKVNATFLCWNLGQETGNALAGILFGDDNPGGKLTVSVPVSTGHIPCYYNKKPSAYNRTYYYENYPGGSIYPFGFGLSYTSFKISNIQLEKVSINKSETIKVTAEVSNTGEMDGSEVVQMYIRDIVSSVTRPMKSLKDFQKVFLRKGEMKKVEFTITPEKLSFYDRDMNFIVEPGDFEIMIGNSSLDKDLQTKTLTVFK